MTGDPLVTIGMPVFNRDKTVGRAIDSVLKQTYCNIELVICDNASCDNTEQICRLAASTDGRVRYYRMENNRGPVANFNAAYTLARGTLFMWLGDDDWIDKTYVEACVAELTAQPDVGFVIGNVRYYFDDAMDKPFDAVARQFMCRQWGLRVLRCLGSLAYISVFYGVFRRALFEDHASLLRSCDGFDWLFMADVCRVGKVRVIPSVTVHRQVRSTTSFADRQGLLRALGYSDEEVHQLTKYRNWHIAKTLFSHIAYEGSCFKSVPPVGRIAWAFLVACAHYFKTLPYGVWRVCEGVLIILFGERWAKHWRNAVMQHVLGRRAR